MNVDLENVGHIAVSRQVVMETHTHLRRRGAQGLEGMALWAATGDEQRLRVTAAIIPEQQGHRTEHGLAVTVSGPELQRISLWLYRNALQLVAQVHSHPTEAFHSDTDDRYAMVTRLGGISIVVPDFAREPFSLSRSAVYRLSPSPWWRLTPRPYWRRLSEPALQQLISVEG